MDDQPFVISTWLHHYKNFSYFAKRIRHRIYFDWHHRIIKGILSRPEAKILIAHPTGEPEVILGFLVMEDRGTAEPVIHFVFVKEELRRMGIARTLIGACGMNLDSAEFTHWTYIMNDLTEKFPGLIYNPYAI